MKHEEGFFQGTEGVQLYYQHWQPDTEPRAIVDIVHGVGEHSGRYLNIVGPLVAKGYGVYGHDHIGHGRSPGQRVFIREWGDYRDNLKAFLDFIGKRETAKPIFIYGHSMGALVVLDYLLHYPRGLRGAIISGAPIELGGTANPFLIAIARVLSVVWPRASFNLNLDGAMLSRDPNVVKTRADDPLRSRMASARWGTEFLRTVAWVKTHAAEIKIPILLIHGGDDRINPVQGTRYLCETISSADKTLRIYPGGYHEPHNDIDHEKVAADIQEWLDRRL